MKWRGSVSLLRAHIRLILGNAELMPNGYLCATVFRAAHDSAKATKAWLMDVKKT